MSKITTLSQIFYGTTVSSSNRAIDFNEGGSELKATLKVGAYSATDYAAEVQRAMREAGSQAYAVAFNRATQKITISAPSNFTLLRSTGSRIGTSAWVMMGFGTGANLTGTNSYLAPSILGSVYKTQYPVDDYIDPEHVVIKENSTTNSTPTGVVQQASFGDGIRITANIRVITNQLGLKNTPFYENANGISDFMTFIRFALTKGYLEFMPNIANPSYFIKCYLEGTKQDKDGRKFVLENMKVPEFYQSGTLTFRKVLV
jgi:hypothetical protein